MTFINNLFYNVKPNLTLSNSQSLIYGVYYNYTNLEIIISNMIVVVMNCLLAFISTVVNTKIFILKVFTLTLKQVTYQNTKYSTPQAQYAQILTFLYFDLDKITDYGQ